MKTVSIIAVLLLQSAAPVNIVREVRSAIARSDFALAERRVGEYRSANGVTPEMAEAVSWLGRGALAAGALEQAEAYAAEAHKLSLDLLKGRGLDDERHLPLALGASIEVHAQVMNQQGERSGAVAYLKQQLDTYGATSIRTRIQKNIHLLSLEGKPLPALETGEWLGAKPPAWGELKGRVVILFFWAHWCGECKRQGPILERLQAEFDGQGLTILAPTQRYGYVARGQEAAPAEEMKYIAEVLDRYYPGLKGVPVPVSEENFKRYGASTTPTLVLADRHGIVRMYHPGIVPYEELAAAIRAAN